MAPWRALPRRKQIRIAVRKMNHHQKNCARDGWSGTRSERAHVAEGRRSAACNHDVVEQLYADDVARTGERAGHCHVVCAGRGVAARMIVEDDDAGRSESHRGAFTAAR